MTADRRLPSLGLRFHGALCLQGKIHRRTGVPGGIRVGSPRGRDLHWAAAE
jgi:hypothetical protein